MTRDEAKRILAVARPWARRTKEDDAAAQLASRDPELARLKSRHEDFNARVHEALAGIPVPPTLRDQIAARRKIIRIPRWRQPRFLAAVAALLVCGISLLFYVSRTPAEDTTFAGFRQRMVGFALREYRMDLFTADLEEVKLFLAEGGTPHQFTLPDRLARQPVKGGARLSWQGKPVSMVCFEAHGHTLYMFVINEAAVRTELSSTPQLSNYKQLSTATWSADGKAFLLAAPISEEQLRAVL